MMQQLLRDIKTPFMEGKSPLAYVAPVHPFKITRAVYTSVLKRTLDIVASAVALTVLSPLFILIALLVKFDSRGPIFYSQTRVGKNRRKHFFRVHASGNWDRRRRTSYGKLFRILKFRSMQVNAEAGKKAVWCQVNDPRVTRMGQILRKTHLDELPQLINILKGDMTLVGPRPERPEVIDYLVSKLPTYTNRLLMRPGLTGLAQICHRSDLELRDVKWKLRYDRLYFQSLSFLTDMKLILGTVPFMLGYLNSRIKKSNALSTRKVESAFPSSYAPAKEPLWVAAGISKN